MLNGETSAARLASSIFRAGTFGRYVVTRFLADSNFHGHRPTVQMQPHLLLGSHARTYLDALVSR